LLLEVLELSRFMKLDVKNLVLATVGAKESLVIELFNEKEDEEVLAERIKGTLNLTRLEEVR
jgi:hypothetical protein